MPRAKKQRPPGPKPGELPVTYSDMVTLLLTFFVFLMSMAEFDVQRLKDFLQAMGGAFGIQGASGAGVLHGGAALTSETSNLNAGSEPFNPQTNSLDVVRSGADTPGEGSPNRVFLTKSVRRETKQIEVSEESRRQFEQAALALTNMPGLEAEMTNQGLKITLEEQFTHFESGSAELPPEAVPRLRQLVQELKPILDQGYEIVISGHTDNVPLGPRTRARFKDNRGLSTERANNVARIFESMGVPPAQISATGYGPYRPIADNSTEEGRAKNRRIEILIKYKEFSQFDYAVAQ